MRAVTGMCRWNFCAVGNYAARFYTYAMTPVRRLQSELETKLSSEVTELEKRVIALLHLVHHSITL